jgi:hypothetical protein
MSHPKYHFQYLFRPGLHLPDDKLKTLVTELQRVGAACFPELPDYQCLSGSRNELNDKAMMVAYRPDGRVAGFCSALLVKVPGMKHVLHLGLTCVDPEDRGAGLTHKLTSRLVIRHLLQSSPFGRVWISNVACVLSSLGNVARNFDSVYPSPYQAQSPSPTHLKIAATINAHYREKIYISDEARFDPHAFVFRGSVKGTVFQKDPNDERYHHRNPALTAWYQRLLDFNEGDEAIQIGHYSWATLLRYVFRRGHKPVLVPVPPAPKAIGTASGATATA